jgi:hypothetical protein
MTTVGSKFIAATWLKRFGPTLSAALSDLADEIEEIRLRCIGKGFGDFAHLKTKCHAGRGKGTRGREPGKREGAAFG